MPEEEMITAGPSSLLICFDSATVVRAACTWSQVELEIGPHGQALGQIVLRGVVAIDVHAADRHRAVEKDRNLRNPLLVHQDLQQVDQLLRPADGKRRHQHHAAARDRRRSPHRTTDRARRRGGWSRSP